jgi:hypothetical protein
VAQLMRDKFNGIRSTLVIIEFQLMVRAAVLPRFWNYY